MEKLFVTLLVAFLLAHLVQAAAQLSSPQASVTFTLQSVQPSASMSDAYGQMVVFNGQAYSYSQASGGTLTIAISPSGSANPAGSYPYSVSQSVPAGQGKQYLYYSITLQSQAPWATCPQSGTTSGTIQITVPYGWSGGTACSYLVRYNRQFYIDVEQSPILSGSVSPGAAWHNAGSTVTYTEAPAQGYGFTSWSCTPSSLCSSSSSKSKILSATSPGTISAQFTRTGTVGIFSNASTVLNTWLPVAALAIILSIMLTGLYYAIGTVIGSKKIKDAAITEMGQALSTAILIVIILAGLQVIGGMFATFVPVSNINDICGTLANAQLGIAQNSGGASSGTSAVCNFIANQGSDLTSRMNYGLAATYVIIANLSNEALINLNGMYQYLTYMNFLGSLALNESICWPLECTEPEFPRVLTLGIQITPFAGYTFITALVSPIQGEAAYVFFLMALQLLVITLLFFAWPYLLAGGIILHATVIGRRIGGMLIALSLVSITVFPMIYLLAYKGLNQATPIQPIGSSTTIQTFGVSEKVVSTGAIKTFDGTNFFVFPDTAGIANFYGCYPDVSTQFLSGNLRDLSAGMDSSFGVLSTEEVTTLGTLLPTVYFAFVPIVTLLMNSAQTIGLSGSLPLNSLFSELTVGVPTSCDPANAIGALFAFMNLYGIMSVAGIYLPIISLLITLSSMKGISALLGGDTNILGIGKYI